MPVLFYAYMPENLDLYEFAFMLPQNLGAPCRSLKGSRALEFGGKI
jgi:hypothetical protein